MFRPQLILHPTDYSESSSYALQIAADLARQLQAKILILHVAETLGPENVMMQGNPFAGKITILVRLDKDGNPVTRQAGDLVGEYKKNPVDVGSKNVDIVLDQVAQ